MSKNVILDCGAHNGCSLKKLLRIYPNIENYEIHCFEPSVNRINQIPKLPNVVLHNVAVTDYKGFINFYADWTTIPGKKKGSVKQVPCIDLSTWIRKNLSQDDFIILKLDIEGNEYGVIEKLRKDNILIWIDEFWIELHSYKYFFNWEDDKRLIKTINGIGKKIYDWDSLYNENDFSKEEITKERMLKMYRLWQTNGKAKIKFNEIKW